MFKIIEPFFSEVMPYLTIIDGVAYVPAIDFGVATMKATFCLLLVGLFTGFLICEPLIFLVKFFYAYIRKIIVARKQSK